MSGLDDLLRYYAGYDEEGRLERDNCHRLEFLTTIHYLDRVLAPRSRILDVAAGTGRYAFYLAGQGHQVTARDVVPAHVETMRRKAADSQSSLDVAWGDARDLAGFDPESFDAVLCMGPLYHLQEAGERRGVVESCLRVLRPGGILAVAYVNRHGEYLAEFLRHGKLTERQAAGHLIRTGCQPGELSGCFYFSHPHQIEQLMAGAGLEKVSHLAADGIAYLLRDRVNALEPQAFAAWLDYHLASCEDSALLGYSLHGLYIGSKP